MSDQKDEQAFEKYLQGNSDLSKHYHAKSTEEPPEHLDIAIITAAKKAATGAGSNAFSGRWYVPLSVAAVVVICFSLVFKIYHESLPGGKKQIETVSKKVEVIKGSRSNDEADKPAGVIQGQENFGGITEEVQEDKIGNTRIMREDVAPSAAPLLKDEPVRSKRAADSYERRIQSLPVEEEAEKILTPESIRESTIRGQSELAASALTPQEWFELINKLWVEGDKEGAKTELKNFLEAYPDYPKEQLEFQIPEGMDMSEINE